MKILIAVPCMDSVPAQFAQSLATLNKVGDCLVAFQMGSLIYTSRNDLAKKAIECACDYVLWLDSDMVFEPNTLEKLLNDREHGDIISGLYFRRVSPYTPTIFDKLEIEEGACKWTDYNEYPDEIFPIGGCGFGCVLTPTSVFMDSFAKYGTCFAPIGHVGEDLSFCWRARQLGYSIVCDPGIKLGHVGHYIVNEDLYKAYKQSKAG